jgi:hypothetical protein
VGYPFSRTRSDSQSHARLVRQRTDRDQRQLYTLVLHEGVIVLNRINSGMRVAPEGAQPLVSWRPAVIAVSMLGLCILAGCQTMEQRVGRQADNLAAAGFLVRPANTPERQAMLNRLPPHQFVSEVNGDDVHYILADPLVCGCLYVGTQQAYNQYKRDQQQRHLADEQALAAQVYQDSAWNWGAWGPWGASYRWGYGGRVGW